MSLTIFISYSHQDAWLVTPLVRLLRATKGLVFQDLDSIEPGKRWREKINEALMGANLVVVFWCFHSSQSKEVENEYRMAILAGKDLLPILLDSTPLPKDLGEFQWIDFQTVVPANHSFEWVSNLSLLERSQHLIVDRRLSVCIISFCIVVVSVSIIKKWLKNSKRNCFGVLKSGNRHTMIVRPKVEY